MSLKKREKVKKVPIVPPTEGEKRKTLKPKSNNQANYIFAMAESEITFCTGPSGSGKTCIAVGLACEYLTQGKVSKIIITRPSVESGSGIGFLPGDLIKKMEPYLVPIIEEMNAYLGKENVSKYRSSGIIEIVPLEFMRGRNFHDSFIILDEAQNATFKEIKMFVTRIGRNSKMVINGDTDQTDLKTVIQGGLIEFTEKLRGLHGISICELDYSDIVRNDLIAKILERLK